MKTAPKIVDNVINKNIFRLNASSLRHDGLYFVDKQKYVNPHISHTKSFNISFTIAALAHVFKWE